MTKALNWLARLLHRVAAACESEVTTLVVQHDQLFFEAAIHCRRAEALYHNGQARWHYVFGQLMKHFPERKGEFARAIEAVLD